MRPRILALFLAGLIAASAIPVRAQVLPPDSSVAVRAFPDIVAALEARLLASGYGQRPGRQHASPAG
ncbi:MAG TPA: hypothetical protein PK251_12520 [Candidatus Latescibacteria bacterium]|nr:hypothetical protein [Candidatus Latescibacterota bacterium]HPK75601.1 hypothetical protein [Candidatus Latescibacterota bacterium]